jgi:hypothetical protein
MSGLPDVLMVVLSLSKMRNFFPERKIVELSLFTGNGDHKLCFGVLCSAHLLVAQI